MYDTKDLGPAPVISNLCRQLKIRETINRIVTWDPKQCLLDPGLLVVALIINLLCRRNPLYLVEEFYREQDVELLFGPGNKSRILQRRCPGQDSGQNLLGRRQRDFLGRFPASTGRRKYSLPGPTRRYFRPVGVR